MQVCYTLAKRCSCHLPRISAVCHSSLTVLRPHLLMHLQPWVRRSQKRLTFCGIYGLCWQTRCLRNTVPSLSPYTAIPSFASKSGCAFWSSTCGTELCSTSSFERYCSDGFEHAWAVVKLVYIERGLRKGTTVLTNLHVLRSVLLIQSSAFIAKIILEGSATQGCIMRIRGRVPALMRNDHAKHRLDLGTARTR